MKIKEINKTANVAWSPKQQHPIYLVAGTAAQQLDATFSTTSEIEIYHVDLASKDLELPVAGSITTEHRFHKIIWSDCGLGTVDHPNGLICGGTDNGEVCIVDASLVLAGNQDDAILHTLKDHQGPVTALDTNKFQNNLLASGAGDSDIFIWDLNKPVGGLTPGPKTVPPDQISCLAWNHQVQHILASSSKAGRVVVWDLRKSEPIIKVGDQSTMFHYKSIAWHPDVATQMLIGNEDDRYPVIQMWDLRFATSPMKVFEGHTRGVMSLAWCPQDSDLLMSCGKDNRILCWNPNTQLPNGEIIYELPTAQWASDVSWCPRNPGLVSTSAFDGHITISTLMGGSQQISQQQSNQISDSFGIQQDSFQQPQSPTAVVVEPLKKPPKWMRKPCGARFGFGGKLVSFGNFNEPGVPPQVFVSQVITDTEFVRKSHELEDALLSAQFVEYCDLKISMETNPQEKLLWQFLKSNFHGEPRLQFLDLLGYNPQELSQKISGLSGGCQSAMNDSLGVNAAELASKMEKLQTGELVDRNEDRFGSGSASPFANQKTPPGSGDVQSALFDAIAAGTTQEEEEIIQKVVEPFSISTDNDTDGLVCQALLTGNFEAAVDVCFNANRMADGLLLAIAGGPDLFSRTQKQYLSQAQSAVSKVISAVVNRDWRDIVEHVVIDNWKESLSMLVTYSKAEEFSELCCILGERLENEINDYNSAILCYVCAGDVEKMVSCWSKSHNGNSSSPLVLQNLIEKVMILKKSVESERYQNSAGHGSNVSAQLCNYATLLSSQGNLQTAMVYLSAGNEEDVNILKDRVFRAHGNLQMQAPECPFRRVDVRPQQQHNRQPQQKVATPTYGRQPFSPAVHQQTPPFSPVASSAPSNYYNPAASTYKAPVSNQPNFSHSNMYQPPPMPSANTKSQPPTMMNQPPTMMNQPYGGGNMAPSPMAPPSQFHPTQPPSQPTLMYNPTSTFNQQPPQPAALYNPATSFSQPSQPQAPPQVQPNLFNPASNMGHTMSQPPPLTNMMSTGPPPELTPPPSHGHPMSMKAAKESTPSPTVPQQPMNFYNPAAAMQQQQLNGPSGVQGGMNQPPAMIPSRSTMPGQTQLPHPQPVKKEPEPPKPEIIKSPIPAEHIVLQQTFDAILDRCRNASNNPQTKRKIEDVRKKLEVLYDLLRSNKVSQNVLNGLHQMVQACQQMDYMVGIQIHTHMITTGNFSEISSFMPGLKTLMQIAGQLKV